MAKGLGVSGTTLVELMIAVGLFGLLSLALFGMLATYLVRVRSAEKQVDLSNSIQEFQEFVDADLANATQLIQCGCGVPDGDCVYQAGTTQTGIAASTSTCHATVAGTVGGIDTCASELLLYYETETAQYPIAASSPMPTACLQPKWVSPMPVTRGCKQRRILRFKAPNPALDQPGELQLLVDNVSTLSSQLGAALLDTLPVLARLPGVYEVNCGLVQGPDSSTTPPAHLFRIDARAKARQSNSPKGSSDWEGWVSTQTNFNKGVHRQVTVMTEFRNLTFPGVQFGRLSSSKNCVADGDTDSTGTGNCCSGYMDSTGTCLSMDGCAVSGTAMSESNFYQCCSHKVYNGSCS